MSNTSFFAFGGACNCSLAAFLTLSLHLAVLSLTSLALDLLLADSFFVLTRGSGLPFEILKTPVLFISLVLANFKLDTLSVEVKVNTNANYLIVGKDAVVLADILLVLDDQGHLLLGNLDYLFIACAVFFAEYASSIPLGVELTLTTTTVLSWGSFFSEISIPILARFASVSTSSPAERVATDIAILISLVSPATTGPAIALNMPLVLVFGLGKTFLRGIFAIFFRV